MHSFDPIAPRSQRSSTHQRRQRFWILFAGCFLIPCIAHAYIGPGAGFVFLSSFFVFFITLILALLNLVTWPFRVLFKALKQRKAMAKAKVGRVVVVGLDGLDPRRCDQLISAGQLPHLADLAQSGCFVRLESTCPPISPVAWSTFATGVNPGKHNIFDFLMPNRKLYVAELSSVRMGQSGRGWGIGPLRLPGRPSISLLRKSQSFWSLLGKQGIFSTILRVPITFPPEKFKGTLLSAMCVPDLRGTQGSFSCYTTQDPGTSKVTGGTRVRVQMEGDAFASHIVGPPSPSGKGDLQVQFKARVDRANRTCRIDLPGESFTLKEGVYSEWIPLTFKAGLTSKVFGRCLFRLMRVSPELVLYVSPVHIDPDKPAMPIATPMIFSSYLAKLHGPFASLGLAEDTWALNERVLDDKAFLEQCEMFHEEREKMFFSSLKRTRKGACVCVFDMTDRTQHMFMRYADPKHPARPTGDEPGRVQDDILDEVTRRMDAMVGRVKKELKQDDCLIVLSDHGFSSFRRGFNANTWLLQNGYLALQPGLTQSGEWYEGVDWSKTKAYALGLAGIYVNLKGRESQGIVAPGEEASSLVREIAKALSGLQDEDVGDVAISKAHVAKDVYSGPYSSSAPEIIVGYAHGYRTSWDSAIGIVGPPVFSDNLKAWSGDHCMDTSAVPGVFFCNRKISRPEARMVDVAPTILTLLGVNPPSHMDGSSLI